MTKKKAKKKAASTSTKTDAKKTSITKIGELSVAIEPSGRGLKGALFYEGGPIPIADHERVLKEVKGKTEADVIAQAQAWLAKRTPKKILLSCARCCNGVELNKKTKGGRMEIYCGACGAVVYRGAPISWEMARIPE